MANANISKLGVVNAVETEKAAMVEAPVVAPPADPTNPVAPNILENRVVGKYDLKTPTGHIIVVENL